MSLRSSFLLAVSLALALLWQAPLAGAVKFDLLAHQPAEPFCVWNFAADNTMVIVTVNSPKVDGSRLDIEILDGSEHSNTYLSKRDIRGETRLAITTHAAGDLGVCISNVLVDNRLPSVRVIDLDIDIGSEAVDYSAIANQESLSVMEVEMRKLEASLKEIVEEMGYLQRREARMRDTNESTNDRVKWFSTLITIGIIALGVWQLVHLRSFFKRKYLID